MPTSVPWCVVCHDWITTPQGKPFCDKHYLEYQARQQEGVLTHELRSLWWDTLLNWRNRPDIDLIQNEPDKGLFRFTVHRRGWLIFMRSYPDRESDWLAVHQDGDKVRRFVEVDRQEVWDDLAGLKPAPSQQNIEVRWGNPLRYRIEFKYN